MRPRPLLASRRLKDMGVSQTEAYVQLGYPADARRYVRAAEVLRELGVRSIALMTNNPEKAGQLRDDGLVISAIQPLAITPTHPKLQRSYRDKLEQGHWIRQAEHTGRDE